MHFKARALSPPSALCLRQAERRDIRQAPQFSPALGSAVAPRSQLPLFSLICSDSQQIASAKCHIWERANQSLPCNLTPSPSTPTLHARITRSHHLDGAVVPAILNRQCRHTRHWLNKQWVNISTCVWRGECTLNSMFVWRFLKRSPVPACLYGYSKAFGFVHDGSVEREECCFSKLGSCCEG